MLGAAPRRSRFPNPSLHRMGPRRKSMGLFRNAGGSLQRAERARSDEAVRVARSARRRNFGEARRGARDSESGERSFMVGTRRPLCDSEAVAILELRRRRPKFLEVARGRGFVI